MVRRRFVRAAFLYVFFISTGSAVPAPSPNPEVRCEPVRGIGPLGAFGSPPQDSPAVLAPGFVSSPEREHSSLCIAPGGREIYFTRQADGRHDILWSRWKDGNWSDPQPVPFTSDALDDGASFSPDGTRLYFGSRRPRNDGEPVRGDTDIWYVERVGDGEDADWGEPVLIGPPVNTDHNESFPTFTSDGTMYFHSDRDVGGERADIYRAARDGDGFMAPERLPDTVNGPGLDGAPYVSPDGSYLLYTRVDFGDQVLVRFMISNRRSDGRWSEAVDIADSLELVRSDLMIGRVSPDGRILFVLADGDIHWVAARALASYLEPSGP